MTNCVLIPINDLAPPIFKNNHKVKNNVVSGCIHYQSSLMAQLSLTEVSKRFKVNRTTIYRAVNNGKLSRLSNGLFDLAEVIRVFGEAQTAEAAPVANKESSEQLKLVEVLERELLFLKNQIEQKDKQINNLTLLLETSAQRPEATLCNDAPQHTETPIDQDMQHDETLSEANSNVTKQHHATMQNDATETIKKPTLVGRFGRGLKAFLKD